MMLNAFSFAAVLANSVSHGFRTPSAYKQEQRNPADDGDEEQKDIKKREQAAARALLGNRGHNHILAAASTANHINPSNIKI